MPTVAIDDDAERFHALFQSSEDVGGHADRNPCGTLVHGLSRFNHPKMWGDMPTMTQQSEWKAGCVSIIRRCGGTCRHLSRKSTLETAFPFQSSEDVGGHADIQAYQVGPTWLYWFQSSEDVGGHADLSARSSSAGLIFVFQSSEDVGGHADFGAIAFFGWREWFQSSEDVGGHADFSQLATLSICFSFQSSEDVGGHADAAVVEVNKLDGQFQSSEDVGGHADF